MLLLRAHRHSMATLLLRRIVAAAGAPSASKASTAVRGPAIPYSVRQHVSTSSVPCLLNNSKNHSLPRSTHVGVPLRPLRSFSSFRDTNSQVSVFAIDEEPTMWPAYACGALIAGLYTTCILLKRDRFIQRLNSCIEPATALGGLSGRESSYRQIGGLLLAFCLTQVPAEELKLRVLEADLQHASYTPLSADAAQCRLKQNVGLDRWSQLVGCFDVGVQQIALGALTGLLEGQGPLRAFREREAWYQSLTQALPPLLHASDLTHSPLSDPEVFRDTLRVACILCTHPSCFQPEQGDNWLYERLLEQSAQVLDMDASSALEWACLASAASADATVAKAMLQSDTVKRWLVHLAAPEKADESALLLDAFVSGVAGRTLGEEQTQAGVDDEWERLARAYSRRALHQLTQASDAEDVSDLDVHELALRHENFFEEFRDLSEPPPPPLPPADAFAVTLEEELAEGITSSIVCLVGGALYGAIRGAAASSRALRPIYRSAAFTAAAAATFEMLMRTKALVRDRIKEPSGRAPPPYKRLFPCAHSTAVDLVFSCGVLWTLVQPGRAPLTFGGWALGRAAYFLLELTEIEVDFEI